nr:hypothetical protein [uncultured Thioclava sp.]
MADGAFGSEAPFAHFSIMNIGPTLCPKLNGVLSRDPENATWSPWSPGLFVPVECYEMEVGIADVVPGLVVDGEDVARSALCKGLGKRARKF